MTLFEFVKALNAGGIPVYHNVAPDKPGKKYIVWQECGGRRPRGSPFVIRAIQVDYYTRKELDEDIDRLMERLDAAGVYAEEPDVTFDEETAYTRYMIECEIVTSRQKEG